MTIIQLEPTIPMVTPKGKGFAHFLIDSGQEHHLKWVVFIDDTGECWTFENPQIRIQKNFTMGRIKLSEIRYVANKVSENAPPSVE